MKRIKMLNIQTRECKDFPESEFEVSRLKVESFNEGWWKGFTMAIVSYGAGIVIGNILNNTILKSKDEA